MDEQINCKKLIQLAVIFTHLILDLEKVHNLPDGNPDLINLLKVIDELNINKSLKQTNVFLVRFIWICLTRKTKFTIYQ